MYPLDTDDDEDIVEAVQDLFKEVHVGDRVGSSSTPCPNPAHKGGSSNVITYKIENRAGKKIVKKMVNVFSFDFCSALSLCGGSVIYNFCSIKKNSQISGEIVQQTGRIEDKVYVAVGNDLKECRSTLLWALQNSGGVCVEVQYIETEYIEKGIVEFVLQHNVRRLVLGAAADMQNSSLYAKEKLFLRGKSIPSSAYVSEGHQIILHTDNPTQDDGTTSKFNEDNQNATSFSLRQERSINDELYDLLVQAIEDADKSKRDAFEESIRCRKLQKDVIEAKRKVSVSKKLCAKELRIRLEVEEMLERTVEELQMELEQKSSLESQIADSVDIVNELEQEVFSKDNQLKIYKKERDKLKVECDDAVRLVEELTEKHADEALNFYSEFESSEVKDVIRNFDPSLKIGEGSSHTTI
ncbi:U-box domain-containing protein 33-like [Rutidosis leptorrhynchoides]|uniref:U-box domain-containing protein 33-like n=1 Tax=Rutidosis leptorrhynchoides TaxID=125765 RepID=UPI003A992B10